MISSPASRGSALSTITRSASPPPKRCLNSIPKLLFTCSKAVKSLSRPSLFRLEIPLRSALTASSRSAFSLARDVYSASTSFASSSARKLTAPSASLCLLRRPTSASTSSAGGILSASRFNFARRSCGVWPRSSSILEAALAC